MLTLIIKRKIVNPFLLIFWVLFHSVLILPTTAQAEENRISSLREQLITLRNWEVAADPAPLSCLPQIPDSLWTPIDNYPNRHMLDTGNWLMRTKVVIDDSLPMQNVPWLFPRAIISAYEIYWDGQKVAQNGIVGADRATEKPGKFKFEAPIPIQLAANGKHNVVIRISNFRNASGWKWHYGILKVGAYNLEIKNDLKYYYQGSFIAGLLLIPFLFNLFLYFTRKRRIEHLIFSLICLIVILDHFVNMVTYNWELPTTFIHWQVYLYQAFAILNSILFPVFFIFRFAFKRKIILLVTGINLLIFFLISNFWNVFDHMSLTVLVESTMLMIWALFKRREDSVILFSGIILAWIAYFFSFPFVGLITVMVVCTSLSIARKFARTENAEKEAQLRSTRLENELLKKNINPHFLMNSLTSIIVWLRREPKNAIKLIEALAEEFRMIIQISGLNEISVQQEVNLCRTHLQIMNYRKGANFELKSENLLDEEKIPPMIFHTLVENGLTHGYENRNEGIFTIKRKESDHRVQFLISNDGEFGGNEERISSGMGLKYVKTRLEENFPNRWKLESNKNGSGWEVTIQIRKK